MKIKLLIASDDKDYCDHLSNVLLTEYASEFNVSVCSCAQTLESKLKEQRYDVALFDSLFCESPKPDNIALPLVLWHEDNDLAVQEDYIRIRKYQRISSMFNEIMEQLAGVTIDFKSVDSGKAKITAVWSPSGGVGKTSVALALSANKASDGKQVIYLNLELFSGTSVFFDTSGKSISALFEMLESSSGNKSALIKSILCRDSITGISYFRCPDYFDDMNILSVDIILSLITACSEITDELIIDMSCLCDERARAIFDIADKIYLVTDSSKTSHAKMKQFISHNNIFSQIKEKTELVANKDALPNELFPGEVIKLPRVHLADESAAYKSLAVSLMKNREVKELVG